MTLNELFETWSDGIPASGGVVVRLEPWARDGEMAALLDEGIEILEEALNKAFRLFDFGFEFSIVSEGLDGDAWTLRFSSKTPSSDAFAYFLSGLDALLGGFGVRVFRSYQVFSDTAELVPHRMIVPTYTMPEILNEDREVMTSAEIAECRGHLIYVELSESFASFDDEIMRDAMFAIGELLDVGIFDPKGDVEEEFDTSTPSVGYDREGKNPQIGIEGFRGNVDFVPVLLAAVSQGLDQILPPCKVVIEEGGDCY